MNPSFTDASSDSAYLASAQLASGFAAGIVPSSPWNKFCIQVSTMVCAIGTVLANLGWTVSDASMSGVVTALAASFTTFAGVNAQTGTTYPIVAADRHKLITLTNASAIAVSLPQAGTTGFANGYRVKIVNLGAGVVTITPATSTIGGASTLVLTTGQSVEILSDETNYLTINPVFNAFNLSSNVTITSGAAWSVTHALGTAPKAVQCWLVNLTAEAGYVTGDKILITNNEGIYPSEHGSALAILSGNTTTINGRYSSNATVFQVNHGTTGAATALTNANWALQVASWA
jgi:hypothetical protein